MKRKGCVYGYECMYVCMCVKREDEGERSKVHGWVSGCHGDHRRLKLCFY